MSFRNSEKVGEERRKIRSRCSLLSLGKWRASDWMWLDDMKNQGVCKSNHRLTDTCLTYSRVKIEVTHIGQKLLKRTLWMIDLVFPVKLPLVIAIWLSKEGSHLNPLSRNRSFIRHDWKWASNYSLDYLNCFHLGKMTRKQTSLGLHCFANKTSAS